jgi:hypothetical protein
MEVFGYRIVPEGALAESLHLHVFARAYREAWVALHARPPVGTHSFESLGVAIDFKESSQAAGRTPD